MKQGGVRDLKTVTCVNLFKLFVCIFNFRSMNNFFMMGKNNNCFVNN